MKLYQAMLLLSDYLFDVFFFKKIHSCNFCSVDISSPPLFRSQSGRDDGVVVFTGRDPGKYSPFFSVKSVLSAFQVTINLFVYFIINIACQEGIVRIKLHDFKNCAVY